MPAIIREYCILEPQAPIYENTLYPGRPYPALGHASGNLQFAKIYTQAYKGATRPVQLISAGANNLLMADQFFGSGSGSSSPFFNLLSLNGDVQVSRGYPFGQSPNNLDLNEVNYYQGNFYFSSRGILGLNTYVLDMNLNLSSAVGTVASAANQLDAIAGYRGIMIFLTAAGQQEDGGKSAEKQVISGFGSFR